MATTEKDKVAVAVADEQSVGLEDAAQPFASASKPRRILLLVIFCFALFLDAFMTSGMIICVDSVSFSFPTSLSCVSY